MKSLRLMACSAMLLPSVALAQQQIPTGSLPPDIAAAIKAAPLTQTLIPISGEEKFAQQIIKADEISFAAGAKLTLTGLNYPYIVVAAQRIKFANPDTYSIIQRDPQAVAAVGSDGPAGPNGADNPGETNRTGNPGYPGGPGGPAVAGQTRQLPDVYLVAGELSDPKGPIPAGLLNLVLLFRGIDGGDGGTGGKGGNGGRAGNGKEGATSLFDCKEGGGPGGTGGAAGPGGRGGDAGAGGQGADLVFVTTRPAYEVLSYSRINNVGGRAGLPGRGGSPGNPGPGGKGAPANGWCKGTGGGSPGNFPSPANLGFGNPSPDGAKGTVTAVILPSVGPLFGK
ncbi:MULTISPECIES: hypothetical protein [unclassified Bradyrhizobium]|uniref:hypothetical protein n=1 Tax=unclassified Bradyrhizobium TaxID=2631580 RepID=UPI0028E33728|nr:MULTISPECIES: hypothetical protein [unclassified Bradyrhizobium]